MSSANPPTTDRSRHSRRAAVAAAIFAAVAMAVGAMATCRGPGGLTGALAVATAPEKPSARSSTPLAERAEEQFWKAFRAGNYHALPEVISALSAAYLEHPHDPQLALLLAQSHLWRVTERGRREEADPRMTDHLILARYYFSESYALREDDQRLPGWIGSTELALGSVHNRPALTRRGYFRLRDAADDYPEFNGFTFAFSMSTVGADDPVFAEALKWARTAARRCGPDVDPEEKDPACRNSDLAPHNVEGFLWNLALMEQKAGNDARAAAIAADIQELLSYDNWPFREAFEQDLTAWGTRDEDSDPPTMLFDRDDACVVCHQAGPGS